MQTPSSITRSGPLAGASAASRVRHGANVLDVFVDAPRWDDTIEHIWRWARFGQSRQVVCCNVHMLVEARRDPALQTALARADLVTPDGMPVVWMLRQLGFGGQQRINGPDLMWRTCAMAEVCGLPIYLHGTTGATLARLRTRLASAFPRLVIAGCDAPPFGVPTPAELAAAAQRIQRSGARIVFVGLGCPRQELWMMQQRGRLQAVMLGVGAAFDYHAGTVQRAPDWMQRHGLEWLYRLAREPRRLWKRYASTNSRFVAGALAQLARRRRASLD